MLTKSEKTEQAVSKVAELLSLVDVNDEFLSRDDAEMLLDLEEVVQTRLQDEGAFSQKFAAPAQAAALAVLKEELAAKKPRGLLRKAWSAIKVGMPRGWRQQLLALGITGVAAGAGWWFGGWTVAAMAAGGAIAGLLIGGVGLAAYTLSKARKALGMK